jgi:endo-1,4-beta-xylanase
MQKLFHRFLLLLSFLFLVNPVRAALPEGANLLEPEIGVLRAYSPMDTSTLTSTVDVTDQPFKKALRINSYGRSPNKGESGLIGKITKPLKKGDVLWLSFMARKIESKRETGDVFFEARVDQLANGKYKWPSHLDRGISVGPEWTAVQIPFVMEKDAAVDEARFLLRLDTYEQIFEISPITLINYGDEVKVSDLPRSQVRYAGWEPDAAWRQAAADRIEKIRKGDITVKVLDKNNEPVSGADVRIQMTRNAYNWGTAVDAEDFDLSPKGDKYREVLKKNFNQVVHENDLKMWRWAKQTPEQRGAKAKKMNVWLRENGFSVRGHVMVWPGWTHAGALKPLKDDPDAMRKAVLDHISEQTTVMKGEFQEWDVINEVLAHHDVVDIVGKQEMIAWFKAARTGAPEVKLFYNEYTMFHGKGEKSDSQKFYDLVKYLKDNGAPIDVIGEQAHIGGTPPAIESVLERLDYFSKLGLPIQISEFDINSSDDDFKANYTRDFMTAIYSHPNTVGFVQWGFWEGRHWFPIAALWNRDWTIRKQGQVYSDLVTKTWWTDVNAKTDKTGTSKVRGFTGEYEISVTRDGKVTTKKVSVDNNGSSVEIRL